MAEKVKKICIVVSSAMTVKVFLLDQLRMLAKKYNVSVMVNEAEADELRVLGLNARILPVCIKRNIAPLSDLRSLHQVFKIFRREKFSVIHSFTPKAGLVAMSAGFLARIPVRIHTFTGQVWATRKGFSRSLLKCADRVIARLATNILVDGKSQRQFIIEEGVVLSNKCKVLANGSISGVDEFRFQPNRSVRQGARQQLRLGEDELILLYLGRLKYDKGLLDLARALSIICKKYKNVHLVCVGPDEENVKASMESICSSCSNNLHFISYTDAPEKYLTAADIFCLPSYREGFGSVVLEAACCGIPTVGSKIYGLTDAIEDGHSGLLFRPGNVDELVKRIVELVEDEEKRMLMGEYARKRAIRDFSKTLVTTAVLDYYENQLIY